MPGNSRASSESSFQQDNLKCSERCSESGSSWRLTLQTLPDNFLGLLKPKSPQESPASIRIICCCSKVMSAHTFCALARLICDDTIASANPPASAPSRVSRSQRPSLIKHDHSTSESLLPCKPAGSSTSSSAGQQPAAGKAPTRRRAGFLKNWWMEVGACFLLLVAFVAIIATLFPHQGKPSPQWPYQISISSLVSIYVVVLKATVLFVTAEGLCK